MFFKKICLSLLLIPLLIPMMNSAIPSNFNYMDLTWGEFLRRAGTEAVYDSAKNASLLPIGLLIYIVGKKVIKDVPDNAKLQRLVAIQEGRIATSNHLNQCIEKMLEKKNNDGLTPEEEAQLASDTKQKQLIETAIRKSAHQFEKPSRKPEPTGWLLQIIQPIVNILPN